jgi:hypothetical protein
MEIESFGGARKYRRVLMVVALRPEADGDNVRLCALDVIGSVASGALLDVAFEVPLMAKLALFTPA